MAKRFKKGDTAYVPVTITEVEHEDRWYDYVVKTPAMDGVKAEFPFCVADEEIKTAEEVAGLLKTKADVMTVTADSLQKENEKLEAELTELEKKNLELENENGKLTAKVNNLETDCEKYRQSNIALRRTVDALTASEDKNTHRAMLMDSLIEILLEKIDEMRKK